MVTTPVPTSVEVVLIPFKMERVSKFKWQFRLNRNSWLYSVIRTFLVLSTLNLGFPGTNGSVLTEMEKPVPVKDVEAVLGGAAELPCDILPEDAHDDVYLVLWFKDEATKPMYSLDVRGKPLNQASHWSESSSLGKRSSFRTQSTPNSLIVEDLTMQDEGIYRCRVDYRNSPTKNVKLNLTIIVPPDKPTIRNQNGRELLSYEIGPYEIDEDLMIDCEVTGGSPAPKVTWWKGGVLFDSSDEVVHPPSSRTGPLIRNRMIYRGLQREDLGLKFTCQASNTNLSVPVSREVKVILNLRPTSLAILAKPKSVSASKELEVVCQAVGGFPPPQLSWWLGSKKLRPFDETSYNGVSKSTLRFTPQVEDDGRYLTCRAESLALHNTAMEDQWHLQIHYPPVVTLRLGRNLDRDNIRTGHDVYFECDVQANPPPLRLEWIHNGRQLSHDPDKRIIMSTQSLVLQKVEKEAVGEYVCRAVNAEGTGESNPVPLQIMYAPTCASQMMDQLIGVTAEENISINCRVDAYPPVVTFSWFFNNSEHRETLEDDRFSSKGLVSNLDFRPTTTQDYGTLYCQGENIIGHQVEPCAFQIVPTGRPAPLTKCQIFSNANFPLQNSSESSSQVANGEKTISSSQVKESSSSSSTSSRIRVDCSEGFDGGLPQTFLLEVYEADELKTKVTNQQPNFEINNFNPSAHTKMFVFAQNAKGSSEAYILEEDTIINMSSSKHTKHMPEGVTDSKAVTGSKSTLDLSGASSSLVVIVTGVACGVIFTVLVVCLLVTCRQRRPPDGSPPPNASSMVGKSTASSCSSSSSSSMLRDSARAKGSSKKRKNMSESEVGLIAAGGYQSNSSDELYLRSHGDLPSHHDPDVIVPSNFPAFASPECPSSCQQNQPEVPNVTNPMLTDLNSASLLRSTAHCNAPNNKTGSMRHPNKVLQQPQLNALKMSHPGGSQAGGQGGGPSSMPGLEWYPPPPANWRSHGPQNALGHMGGTLGRHPNNVRYTAEGGNAPGHLPPYPLYHTCERQKKKVTIMEDNNTESSV